MSQCPACRQQVPINARSCPHCGAWLSETEDDAAQASSHEPNDTRSGVTPGTVGRIVAVVFAALLLGGCCLSMFLVNSHPISVARRTASRNNLKQIGLAIHNYHDSAKALPSGGTFDDQHRGLHSWQTRLLPYMDQETLYREIRFDVGWNHPENAEAFATTVQTYLHPHYKDHWQPKDGFGLSDYAANSRLLLRNASLTFKDVGDGLANTLMSGEVSDGFKPWGDPSNTRDPAVGAEGGVAGFGSPYPYGPQFVMGDGSIRVINPKVSSEILKALATPDGGEQIDWSAIDGVRE